MWKFGILCLFVAGASAIPAYSSSGASAGSFGGTGGTGGFTYAGRVPGFGYGLAPPFGFGYNNDLHNFISSQYNHLQGQFNNIASLYNKQFAQQAAFLNQLPVINPGETVVYTNYPAEVVTDDRVDAPPKKKVTYNTNYAPTYSGATYGASASGAVGPGGVYQSVSTYPGGTLSNRFGNAPTSTYHTSSGGPGFSGISTFSSSDSSGNRQAVTSVNDNGKVTTYHTRQ